MLICPILIRPKGSLYNNLHIKSYSLKTATPGFIKNEAKLILINDTNTAINPDKTTSVISGITRRLTIIPYSVIS